ncbi:MAG: carboxynorspermidine decarboxylase [Methylococcales bacterium]|nr:carboxynorspermidine decarboxylase [Methylococcales bacterium]
MKPVWLDALDKTPALVIDIDAVVARARGLAALAEETGCRALYSIKALPLLPVLEAVRPYVSGFSVSSLYEAQWAAEILQGQGELHLTSPGLIAAHARVLARLATHISANSRYQYRWLSTLTGCQLGMRLNPEHSVVQDARYNPCRPASKLGCAATEWPEQACRGLHIHNAHGLCDHQSLAATVAQAQTLLGAHWTELQWLNLGGGYLWHRQQDQAAARAWLKALCQTLPAVYIEPGLALVGDAGYLVGSVLDTFVRDGCHLAVLDTSVNHVPEVFEYQTPLPLRYPESSGATPVLWAGGTCLAGDLLGETLLPAPPDLGQRVVFGQAGAYSLVKAQRFNGHPLPSIYVWSQDRLECVYEDSYQDVRRLWGGRL